MTDAIWRPDILTRPIEVQWPTVEFISIVLSANFTDIDPDIILITHALVDSFGLCFPATYIPTGDPPPTPITGGSLIQLIYANFDTISLGNAYKSSDSWFTSVPISPVNLDALLATHQLDFGSGTWARSQVGIAAFELLGAGDHLYGTFEDTVFGQIPWAPEIEAVSTGEIVTNRRDEQLIGSFYTVPVRRTPTLNLRVPAHRITGGDVCTRAVGGTIFDNSNTRTYALSQEIAHEQTLDLSGLTTQYNGRPWQFAGVAVAGRGNSAEIVFEPTPEEEDE